MTQMYFAILLLLATPVWASGFVPLFRGARAQAMGNAFTAVADDDEAIFYNPAGLAGVKNVSLDFVAVDLDLSKDLTDSYSTYKSAISNFNLSSVNTLIGKNYSVNAQGYSSIILPGFGFSVLYDYQAAIRLQNLAFPQGMLGLQNTYGGQFAFGTPIFKLKKKKGELRFGVAGKVLWKSGGYRPIDLSQLMTANTSSITGNITQLGMGYGVDSGFQFVYYANKRLTLQAGIAWTDIGDTAFSSAADPIKNNLTAGIAGTYSYADLTATLSYDYGHILDYAEWQKKNHLGLELKFPLFSFYGGINQVSYTYGVGLNIAFLRLMYLSYAEDQATLAGQDTERRQMVQFALKFDL